MTTTPDNPTSSLPDELLLDLVEGTLRSEDVERVRAALKADPRLARRLEAMRTDRRTMTSFADPGVAPAPVGLVADAMNEAERGDLLDAPTSTEPGRVRRLAPVLMAACVGVVAVAGWYAYSEGLILADEEPQTPHVVQGPPVDASDRIDGTNIVQRDPSKSPSAFRDDIARRIGADPLGGDVTQEPSFAHDALVGGPLSPDLLVPDEDNDARVFPDLDVATNDDGLPSLDSIRGNDTDTLWADTPPSVAPDAVVPDEAARWARTGRLVVVVEPVEKTDAESFTRRLARRLYIAYDPSVSAGWGVTSLPSMRTTGLANATGPATDPTLATDTESDRPMIVTLRLDRDATDDELLAALREMAGAVRTLTDQRVVLERRATEAPDAGPALTVDNLLWWRKPAPLWKATSAYHVPVEARVPSGG